MNLQAANTRLVRRQCGVLVAALTASLLLSGCDALPDWPWFGPTRASSELYGNVDIREVQLAFRVDGRLQSMLAEEGDAVAPGDLLAQLDPQPLEQALAVMQANVARAQAELDRVRAGARPQEIQQARARVTQARSASDEATRNAERQNQLLASRSTSQTAADSANALREQAAAQLASAEEALALILEGARAEDIAAAEAAVLAARAQQSQARTRVEDASLYASGTGVIRTRAREPGSLVAAGQPVYVLSLSDRVFVRAYVDEPQLGAVAPGTEVGIRTDSSDRTYNGRVGFVSPRAEFTPRSVETPELRTDLVYRLRINVLDADQALRQGMPVTVELPDDPSAARS